jgi:hypothetical protein
MNDKEKDYYEFADNWNRQKAVKRKPHIPQTRSGTCPTVPGQGKPTAQVLQRKPMPQERQKIHNYSTNPNRKRIAARKRRMRRIRAAVIGILFLASLVIIILLICRGCGSKDKLSELTGSWKYDEYTVYEFDGKGSGCMCLDGNTHYEFTYSIDGDLLKLDFALDYVTDCEYTFKVDKENLTLVGGNGTSTPGQEYTLIKSEQK